MGNLKDFRILKYQIGLLFILTISIGLINGQIDTGDTTILPSSLSSTDDNQNNKINITTNQNDLTSTTEQMFEDSTLLPELSDPYWSSSMPSSTMMDSNSSKSSNSESSQITTMSSSSVMPSTEKTLSVIPLKDPTPTKDSVNFDDNETVSSSSSSDPVNNFWDFTTQFQKNYLEKLKQNSTNSNNIISMSDNESQTTTSSSSSSSTTTSSSSLESMPVFRTTTTESAVTMMPEAKDMMPSSTSQTMTATIAAAAISENNTSEQTGNKEDLKDSRIIFISTTAMPSENNDKQLVNDEQMKSLNNENIILPSSSDSKMMSAMEEEKQTAVQTMTMNEEGETTHLPPSMLGEVSDENKQSEQSSSVSVVGSADKMMVMGTDDNLRNNLSTEMLMDRETTIMPEMMGDLSSGVIINEIQMQKESHSSSTSDPTESSSSSSTSDKLMSSTESSSMSSLQSESSPSPVFIVGSVSESKDSVITTTPSSSSSQESENVLISSSSSSAASSSTVESTMTTTPMPSESILPSVIVVSSESKGRALNLTEISSSTEMNENQNHHHNQHDDINMMMTMEDGAGEQQQPHHHQQIFHGEGRSADASDPLADEDPYHPHLNFVTTEKSAHYSIENNSGKMMKDLSDVSMDDDDVEIVNHLQHNNNNNSTINNGTGFSNDVILARQSVSAVGAIRGDYECFEDGVQYNNGETMNRDCDEKCTCNNGEWICIPRCAGIFFKRGRTFADPLCHEKYSQEDECCATMICTETARNINEDLNSDLIIENSHNNNNNESTLNSTNAPLLPTIPPTSSSMTPTAEISGCMHNGVMYRPRERLEIGCEQICFCESDGNMNCRKRCPDRQHTPQEKCVLVKDPKDICCQLEFCDVTLDGHEQTEPPSSSSLSTSNQNNSDSEEDSDINNSSSSSSLNDVKPIINGTVLNDGCKYKDNIYKFGEQFHDGCDALCICTKENVHCAQLECPTTFGLDVLDPHCLKWEPEPSTFKAIPPKCCPERMRCVNNGSCEYEGQLFDNWAEIPSNLTGCEKHCYCEGGKVQCRPACAPVQALPPSHLPCHPKDVRLLPIPDDPCCKRWTCVTNDVSNIDYNDNKHKGHKDKIKSQSSSELDDNGKDSNSVGPFYPTIDGKPPKTQLEKPTKNKFNKDNNKDVTGNNVVQQYPIPTSSSPSQPQIKNDVKYDQPFVPIIAQLPISQNPFPQQQHEINNSHNEQSHQHSHHHHQQQQQQQQLQKQQYAIEQQQQQQHHSDNTIGSRQPPITSIQYDLNNQNHRQQQGFNFFDQSQNPNKNQYGGGGGGGSNIEFNNNRHHPYLHDIGIDLSGHHEPNGIIIASGKPSQTELYNILGQNGGGNGNGGIGLGPINTGDNHGLPPPPLPPSLSNQHQQHQHHRQQQQQQQHDTSNLPPHIRIEHILQHLQSNEPNQIQHQQQQHHNNNNNNNHEQKFPIQIGPNHHSHFPTNNRGQLDSLNGNVGGINNSPATQIIHIPISASDGTNHGLPFNSFTIHHLTDDGPGPVSASAGGQSISPNNIIEHQQQQQQQHGTRGLPINQRLPSLPPLLPTPSQTGDFFTNPNSNSNSISPNLEVLNLEAIDPNTVRIVFRVPPVYVNLHGRVELRYTNGQSNDTANWEQQIFAPPEDLIATSQLEFELPNLEPNSLYKIQITLLLRDLGPQPTSGIHTIETPPRTITPPTAPTDYRPDFENIFKNIEDPELNVSESNSTWLRLSWKKLPDNDLEYVDGVQLRYKELDGMLYDATPLIHRTLTSYTLENLQENTAYEIGLYYIPFPGNGAELRAGNMITVRTSPKVDVYGFDVMVNVTKVKSTSVEVSWNGVPYPEDKYVNIYRAIYQSDAGKEDSSVFKVAKRDSTTGTLIMDLKPGTRYRLWLETYLTNGKIKKSNVVNFVTKPGGPAPVPGKTGKLLTAGESQQPVGDYYGPLVVVAVVAALAVMSTLILLTILTRRRTHHTASITPPRKSEAAYDNPSYKVEIQQETMNL